MKDSERVCEIILINKLSFEIALSIQTERIIYFIDRFQNRWFEKIRKWMGNSVEFHPIEILAILSTHVTCVTNSFLKATMMLPPPNRDYISCNLILRYRNPEIFRSALDVLTGKPQISLSCL